MQNCSVPRKTAASNDPTKPVFSSQRVAVKHGSYGDWKRLKSIRWQCLKPLSLWPVRVSSRGLAEAGECFLQKHPTKASTRLQQPQESLYIQLSENSSWYMNIYNNVIFYIYVRICYKYDISIFTSPNSPCFSAQIRLNLSSFCHQRRWNQPLITQSIQPQITASKRKHHCIICAFRRVQEAPEVPAF